MAAARYFQRMRILIAVTLTLACASFANAATEIYRWVDSKGVVHYSDKPQAPNDKPAQLPHLQTYKPGAIPPALAPVLAAPPTVAASERAGFAIASPAQDETIREAERQFTVTVSAGPQSGEGLIYYLDGAALNAQPTQSTAFLYTGVERGDHSIAAALVGADGKELSHTPAVTIHMKPPMVKH